MLEDVFPISKEYIGRLFPAYIETKVDLTIVGNGVELNPLLFDIPQRMKLPDLFALFQETKDKKLNPIFLPTFQSLSNLEFQTVVLMYEFNPSIVLRGKISLFDRNSLFFALETIDAGILSNSMLENKLAQQRRFYEDVLNNLPSDIAVFDTEQRYLFLNPVAIRDQQLRQWIIGKTDEDYCILRNKPLSMLQHRKSLFQQVVQEKKQLTWEEKLTTSNGDPEYHLRMMCPVLDSQNEVKNVIGYGVNITERKIIEDRVKRSEKRYRDLFNYCQALICTHDIDGNILSVNPAVCNMLGFASEELIGKSIFQFLPEKDKKKFHTKYLPTIKSDDAFSGVFQVVHKSGKSKFLLYQNFKVVEIDEPTYIIGFAQDITDRIKAQRQLLKAKKLTEDAAKAKETFLANMSHEIRTPMHGILGMASLLAKTHLEPTQKDYLRVITDAAKNLVVIVNDILDIEKISSGKMEFESLGFPILEKLQNTLQSFQYKAEEKGLLLSLDSKIHPSLQLKGDPYRLGQILNNLLSNAMKFTKHGCITLKANVMEANGDKTMVRFEVEDTGIGIPQDKLTVIFDPFIQASKDTVRNFGGTGLGLSICKNLVVMQGGKIGVDSKLGRGTTFWFTLPYETEPLNSESKIAPQYFDIGMFKGKKVLLAEDVLVNQFLAKTIMENIGIEVQIANNGQEAVSMVRRFDYDLILMDLQMPVMDGITATRIIRNLTEPSKSRIPIIALTANALIGDEQRYFEAGMDDYLTKPFSEEILIQKISQSFGSKEDVVGSK